MGPVSYFNFCPRCKNKLTKKTNRLVDCQKCGFHFYFSPVATNAVVLKDKKGRILLVKRKYSPKQGFWDLPGGFVDYQESLETSVKREILEELNIKIKNLKYFSSQPDRYLYKGINYYTLCVFFVADIIDKKIVPQDDVSTFEFFSKKNIPYQKIAFEGIKKALKKLLNH